MALAHPRGTAPLNTWLGWSLGGFVVGWVFPFVGHFWEGRKPAFVDVVRGLLIGPMFVVAELAFGNGACRTPQTTIEAEAGPAQRRDPARKQRA